MDTMEPMRISRAIFAVLIGLSVAMLPATIGVAAGATTATKFFASQAIVDCDHHHTAPSGKTQKADDSLCIAGCALNYFNYAATGFSGIAVSLPISAVLKPVRVSENISSRMGSPPFRPPRS